MLNPLFRLANYENNKMEGNTYESNRISQLLRGQQFYWQKDKKKLMFQTQDILMAMVHITYYHDISGRWANKETKKLIDNIQRKAEQNSN